MHNIYIAYLAEGPQESWVRHHDDREGHSKAKWKVYDDVRHVPDIPAVPVRGAGDIDALQLITSPAEQRRSVPHKRPHPGQHHSSNCMSEDSRDCLSHAAVFSTLCDAAKWNLDGHYCTWSGTGQHQWDSTPLRSVQQKWLLLYTDLLYLMEKKKEWFQSHFNKVPQPTKGKIIGFLTKKRNKKLIREETKRLIQICVTELCFFSFPTPLTISWPLQINLDQFQNATSAFMHQH